MTNKLQATILLVQSLPSRAVRFALTTAAGAVVAVLGLAVSVVNSFFVEKYLGGYRPKLMLDEIRRLLPPSG